MGKMVTKGVDIATIECIHHVKYVLKEDSVIANKFMEINFSENYRLCYENNKHGITDSKKQKYNLQKS